MVLRRILSPGKLFGFTCTLPTLGRFETVNNIFLDCCKNVNIYRNDWQKLGSFINDFHANSREQRAINFVPPADGMKNLVNSINEAQDLLNQVIPAGSTPPPPQPPSLPPTPPEDVFGVQALLQALVDSQKRYDEAESKLSAVDVEAKKIKHKNETLRADFDLAIANLETAEEELKTAEAELERIREGNNNVNTEVNKLRSANNKLRDDYEGCNNRRLFAEDQVTTLSNDAREARRRADRNHQRFVQSQTERNEDYKLVLSRILPDTHRWDNIKDKQLAEMRRLIQNQIPYGCGINAHQLSNVTQQLNDNNRQLRAQVGQLQRELDDVRDRANRDVRNAEAERDEARRLRDIAEEQLKNMMARWNGNLPRTSIRYDNARAIRYDSYSSYSSDRSRSGSRRRRSRSRSRSSTASYHSNSSVINKKGNKKLNNKGGKKNKKGKKDKKNKKGKH